MICTLILASILGTQQAIGPVLPPGTTGSLSRAFLKVQERLAQKEFDAAARLAVRLPHKKLIIEWNDAKVPLERKAEFLKARGAAVQAWKEISKDIEISFGKPAQIKIEFVAELPPNSDSPGPAGAVFFSSYDGDKEAVEALIALRRGNTKTSIESYDVINETLFAITSYFGLERTLKYGTATYRQEGSYHLVNSVSGADRATFEEIFRSLGSLRTLIEKKVSIKPARPQINVLPASIEFGTVAQGATPMASFTVSNGGTGPLYYKAVPDCGCFSTFHDVPVQAGESGFVRVIADTADFSGNLDKTLLIYSNDPETPVLRVPLKIKIQPRYRFLRKNAQPTILYQQPGHVEELFLAIQETEPFQVKSISVNGVGLVGEFEPWEGEMADPELNDPPKKRKGYKVKLMFSDGLPSGRVPFSVLFQTSDSLFPKIHFGAYIQKGIVAIPESIYFGELGQAPARAWSFLSRPGKAFKVTKIVSDNSFVVAEIEATSNLWEHKLIVKYKGKGNLGDLRGTIQVHTDDPKQPVIQIPWTGVVL